MDVESLKLLLKKNKMLVGVGVFVIVIGVFVFWLVFSRCDDQGLNEKAEVFGFESQSSTFTDDGYSSESEIDNCYSYVDVSGAVVDPGVYCVNENGITDKAIELAGGLTDSACKDWVDRNINLAGIIEPNSKLYIPFIHDTECSESTMGVSEMDVIASEVGPVSDCVSINSALQSELETLSGVGPSTALKIIDGRPYDKIEDLTNVNGIGSATLAKFEEDICL